MGFILAKRILREHPNGFRSAIVEGRQGIGKTSYCIKVMKEVYQVLYDLSDEDAYLMALEYVLFSIDDIIIKLNDARKKREMIPCLTWDDAGVHGSNIKWFKHKDQVDMIKSLLETARTRVSGFLINCTSREGLMTCIRNQRGYVVEIGATDGHNLRVAKGYNLFRLPSGTKRTYKNFVDEYSCYLPIKIYNKYQTKRESYSDEAIEIMMEEYLMKQKMKPKTTNTTQT